VTPITRWFEAHVVATLDRTYRRIDEHATQLDPQHHTDAAAPRRKPHQRFRRAA
jgi:hypothetical protein